MTPTDTSAPKPLLTRTVWGMLLLLGLAGQLAWAVENQFFNTFLYDRITPNPQAVSLMSFVITWGSIMLIQWVGRGARGMQVQVGGAR